MHFKTFTILASNLPLLSGVIGREGLPELAITAIAQNLILGLHTDSAVSQVFLNIVLDEAVEEKDGGEKVRLGMVVRMNQAIECPS